MLIAQIPMLDKLFWLGPEIDLTGTILAVLLIDLWKIGRGRSSTWLLAPLIACLACWGLLAGAGGFGAWVLPEFMGLVAIYLIFTVADLKGQSSRAWVLGITALIGAVIAFWRLLQQGLILMKGGGVAMTIWGGLVRVDGFGFFLKALALIALVAALVLVLSFRPMKQGAGRQGVPEYLCCLLGATLGGLLLVATQHVLFLFLALETLSLSSYLQAGMLKNERRSTEASIKYLVYGSVASGIMLFGFSLLYGFSGSWDLAGIGVFVADVPKHSPEGVLMALGLLAGVGGFAYKLSLVPFHFWAPDVYEGAPTPTTAFLTVASKAVSFGIFLRFLFALTGDVVWTPGLVQLLAIVAALTMTLGNFAALRQQNLKRLLGYSSIAHAGYIMMGAVAVYHFLHDPQLGGVRENLFMGRSYAAVLFYLAAYMLMNLGAFAVLIFFSNRTQNEDLRQIRGLGWKSPWVAGAMIIFLLSLTGIPPTAGFFAKWYIFRVTIDGGFLWLAIVAALNTVVSLFYYFRIAKALFLTPEKDALHSAPTGVSLTTLILVLAAATLLLGVFPERIHDLAITAARSLSLR